MSESAKPDRSTVVDLARFAQPAGWGAVAGMVVSGNVPGPAAGVVAVITALALFVQVWRRS